MRWIVLAMLLLAGPVAAQGLKAAPGMADAAAALPAELAGWRRGAVTDFELRPGGAGLGAATEYRPMIGGSGVATIYLYDRGRHDLRDGVAASEVESEIRGAVAEVEAVGPMRGFQVASRAAETDLPGPGRRPGLRCQGLVLAFQGGQRADSFVCVGVVGGHFLKLRMTLPAAGEDFSAKATEAFAQALLAVVQPPPAPVARRSPR